MVSPRLAIAGLVTAAIAGNAMTGRRPACTLKVAPLISLAPLTYLRITTHIDEPAEVYTAAVALVDEDGPIRQSSLWEGKDAASLAPRTVQTEWRNLHIAAGTYEVVFRTSVDGCGGRQVVEVRGNEP